MHPSIVTELWTRFHMRPARQLYRISIFVLLRRQRSVNPYCSLHSCRSHWLRSSNCLRGSNQRTVQCLTSAVDTWENQETGLVQSTVASVEHNLAWVDNQYEHKSQKLRRITCIVTFWPSFKLVPLALAEKSKGKQKPPSPCFWKNGFTCEKLLKDVAFIAEETKTPARGRQVLT